MQTGRSLPVEFFKAISERVRFERVLGLIGRMTLRDEVFLGLVVAAIAFPLISIRAYHYEEGLTAALAKDALSGSPWYVPDLFGARWIERPVMQSWIAAAISWPLGGVSQFTVRLPTVAALFAGALLIWDLVRHARLATRRTGRSAVLPVQPGGAAEGGHRGSRRPAFGLRVRRLRRVVARLRSRPCRRSRAGSPSACCSRRRRCARDRSPPPSSRSASAPSSSSSATGSNCRVIALAGIVSLGILASWYVAVYRAADIDTLLEYMRLSRNETIFDYLAYRLGFMTVPAHVPARPADRRAGAARLGETPRTCRHRRRTTARCSWRWCSMRRSRRGAGGMAGRGDPLCDAGPARCRGDCRARLRPAAVRGGSTLRGSRWRSWRGWSPIRSPGAGLSRRCFPTRSASTPHRCPDRRGGDARQALHDLSRRCGWTTPCSPISTGRCAICQRTNCRWRCRRRPICWPSRRRLP